MSQPMTCDEEKCLNGESSRVGRSITANLEMNNPGMVAKRNALEQENHFKINNPGMVAKRNALKQEKHFKINNPGMVAKRNALEQENHFKINNPGMVAKRNALEQENHFKINNQGIVAKRGVTKSEITRLDNDPNCIMKPRQVEEMFCVVPGYCFPITYIVQEENCELN